MPNIIDGLAFAREGAVAAGTIPVAAMPRLADLLADTDSALNCRVGGEKDGEGKSWLDLSVSGRLNLKCQRCLAPLALPVAVASRLLLVPAGQPWPDEELTDDGYDAVAAEQEMALLPLFEDEVLLALPIAPTHTSCTAPATVVTGNEPSPFAALAKLKKGV